MYKSLYIVERERKREKNGGWEGNEIRDIELRDGQIDLKQETARG